MTIDLQAAQQFIESNARVLERHRLAFFLDGGSTEPMLRSLIEYQNADGGFGHALEPDVRCPASQPSAALSALEVLVEIGAPGRPVAAEIADWISSIAHSDGGVPTVLPSALDHPRAPWMQPQPEAGFLTYALAGRLWHLGITHPWLDKATSWCWKQIETAEEPAGYTVHFALMFLDEVPDSVRVADAVQRFRSAIGPDGTVPVPGGVEGERITPLTLSPAPGSPSRHLFTDAQIEADLDRLENEQLDDGGWDFDFLHFTPGQSLDWRGIVTLQAVRTLQQNHRL